MLWNKDFNSFLLWLFANDAQSERLQSLLEREEFPIKEIAEYLEHNANADYCINALSDSQNPEASNIICQLYIEALKHGYSQVEWIAENNLKYLAHRNLELVVSYLSHPEAKIRSNFCHLFPNPEAIPSLLKLLDDEDTEVRDAAINAVGRLAHLACTVGFGSLNRSEISRRLLEYMKQKAHNVLDEAYALCQVGEIEHMQLAFRDSNKNIRLATASCMRYLYTKKAIPTLLDALNDTEWSVRRFALMNLRHIAEEDIIPELFKFHQDNLEDFRITLMETMIEIGSAGALPYLRHFTTDPSTKVRQTLLHNLRAFKHEPEALSIAETMLQDADPKVQGVAQMAIKSINGN